MIYALSFFAGSATAFSGSELINDFNSWKSLHAKTYASADLEAGALAAYSSNDAIIKETNAKGLSYTLGHNEFSDMTWEEFSHTVMSSLYTNVAPKNMNRVHIDTGDNGKIADSLDWVTKGAVTPVKNQGRCGSCWAFSSTGSIEGAYQVATGNLVSISEEQLVQCDHNGDNGCQGGLMDNALTWVTKGHALCTESDYPYTSGGGVTGTCVTGCKGSVTLTGHKDVPSKDEDALKAAVAIGPVSIAIEADKSAFQMYKGGVLDSTACGTKLDHGVLIVGYGTDAGVDYWKVKNSWGATWGESGYIRMARGKNMCGLAQQPSYPTGVGAAGPSPPGPSPGPSPPSPTPPSPPAGKSHYSDPKDGCLSDEIEITITNIKGDFCSSECSIFKKCPADVPTGVTAGPQCALQDASTNKHYCALICSPTLPVLDQKAADAQCGTNASCKPAGQGVGLCTYDD